MLDGREFTRYACGGISTVAAEYEILLTPTTVDKGRRVEYCKAKRTRPALQDGGIVCLQDP